MNFDKHTIAILVHNTPGVLSRVSGVFGRLGYNIESLCVAETNNPDLSRITLVSKADTDFTEKVIKQLQRLVDVVEVSELYPASSVQRELLLIGTTLNEQNRAGVMQALDMFRCRIVSLKAEYCIVEAVGNQNETETIINYLSQFGITEIARTGIIALPQQLGA